MRKTVLYSVFTAETKDTEALAEKFAERLVPGDFVALFGGLGAGKTAFVRGMARCLAPGERVSSPTYTIVNEYEGRLPLFHFDMYRIDGEDALYSIGFQDYSARGGVIVTEWSENILFALPDRLYKVDISPCDGGGRNIVITLEERG